MRQGNLQLTLWSLIRKIGLCPVFRIRIEYGSRHFTESGSGSRLLLNPDPDTDLKPTKGINDKKKKTKLHLKLHICLLLGGGGLFGLPGSRSVFRIRIPYPDPLTHLNLDPKH
jgi:hypothetical protein